VLERVGKDRDIAHRVVNQYEQNRLLSQSLLELMQIFYLFLHNFHCHWLFEEEQFHLLGPGTYCADK
jgi:hypothetical protein